MKALIVGFVVLALFVSTCAYEYSLLNRADAQVTKITVVNLSLKEATVAFDLSIQNPAHLPVFVDNISIDLRALGKNIAAIEDSDAFELAAQANTSKRLIAHIPLLALGGAGIAAFQQGKLEWDIEGEANVRVLGIPQTKVFTVQNHKT